MTRWRRCLQAIIILLVVFSLTSEMQTFHPVHAAGILRLVASKPTPIPAGQQIRFDVHVDLLDQFNFWHIDISTNTNALNGTNIDLTTQNVFPSNVSTTNYAACINGGIPAANLGCGAEDRMGLIHVESTLVGHPTFPPHSGILFSIYFLAGAVNYTQIHFDTHLIGFAPDVGSITYLNPTVRDFVYGRPPAPDFRLSLADQFLSTTQGSTVNTTVTASSINSFIGQVNFTSSFGSNGPKGIQVSFIPNNVTLNNSTATSKISISVSTSVQPTTYVLNVTGIHNRLFHFELVSIVVQRPGNFELGFSPQTMNVPQTGTAVTTILLTSSVRAKPSDAFTGTVNLSVATPRNAWTNAAVTAVIGQTSLYLLPEGTNSTTLTIAIPASPYAYNYLLNVTAVSAAHPDINATRTVNILPPPFDLAPTVSPDTLTVTAGHSAYATLNVTGVNYFAGHVYPSSHLSGGTVRFGQIENNLDVGQIVSISLNITIDSTTAPGNYVVLLTVTGQAPSGSTVARSVAESIIVKSSGHSAPLPATILGVSVPIYFGILSGFAALFVLLSVLVYRKSRLDRDEWDDEKQVNTGSASKTNSNIGKTLGLSETGVLLTLYRTNHCGNYRRMP